jgi:hypothetical protein
MVGGRAVTTRSGRFETKGARSMRAYFIAIALAGVAVAPVFAAPPKAQFDTAKIEELTGAKGAFNEKEGVFKVSVPRSDLSITAGGVKLTPPMGLTSWAAFKKVGKHSLRRPCRRCA